MKMDYHVQQWHNFRVHNSYIVNIWRAMQNENSYTS